MVQCILVVLIAVLVIPTFPLSMLTRSTSTIRKFKILSSMRLSTSPSSIQNVTVDRPPPISPPTNYLPPPMRISTPPKYVVCSGLPAAILVR